ncbi:MAG TPA: hypothetical protein VK021_10930 [Flavobacteriaceae bacterium]|nr:hypothetical protein [Flavobacteriaceae bacterium]
MENSDRVSEDSLSINRLIPRLYNSPLLNKTPGVFRVTYPNQLTPVDSLMILLMASASGGMKYLNFLPLGTMLPYFMEDSNHAYVITPGFYKTKYREINLSADSNSGIKTFDSFSNAKKRTVSDVYQLVDDIILFVTKTQDLLSDNPPQTPEELVKLFIGDNEFIKILTELKYYGIIKEDISDSIQISSEIVLGTDWDKFATGLNKIEPLQYGEEFANMYHPLVCYLRNILNSEGIPALMKRETQIHTSEFDFESYYEPNSIKVPKNNYRDDSGNEQFDYPLEEVDFESDGSYSSYNWDLFYRVPLHIATMLTQNQRFEEAMTWFHYMFDPTGALKGDGTQKYWVTKPFYLHQESDYINQRIDEIMNITAEDSNRQNKDLQFAISEWREKPFSPDVIARTRPVAYQKALLMKYIENLTEWGDFLFRQDTMESIAQATQLYILADKLLGPKPRVVPSPIEQPYQTYNQLENQLDSFGNVLIEMENLIPDLSSYLEEDLKETESSPSFSSLSSLYFCIPENEKMQEYWDKIADRLFKIRHCQNIDGVERSLALFAPPIDPGMLARAAASGLDISSVIAGLNAPMPYYRFNVLTQKATELAQEVRSLGSSLLQALEKKDAETLSLLRSELELKVLNAVKDIKKLQIDESDEQIEILKRTKKVTEERYQHYKKIEKISSKEQLNLDKLEDAQDYQFASQVVRTTAGALALIPEFHVGASGFGGSPHVVMQLGGSAMAKATNIAADIINVLAGISSYEANRAATLGGYNRREDDWKLQERLAEKELDSIEKQITAAEIRKEIAETDLKNHELQIENAEKTDEYMRSKFTNKELYDWMIGQISSVYFKSYQLAHDFAKKAERSYQFELGYDDSFISYGYWDSMKKGLQSADGLIHDIKRMETAYLDKNKREYEMTKHVSLAQLDPLALIKLKKTGVCDMEIPEALFDMDHPGQYFRRLKSVSLSIPCIAGPYTSVSSKLSLINNRYRKNTNKPTKYAENMVDGDNRFVYNIGSIQSIATSSSQNDSGLFELNFRDERYLPFEGAGAISSWRLELPTEVKQFDYNTISDVVIHLKYTAREGGSTLKTNANEALKDQLEMIHQGLKKDGLHTAINMKHDMPNQWNRLMSDGEVNLKLDKQRLPYFVQPFETPIEKVIFLINLKGDMNQVQIDGTPLNLAKNEELKMLIGETDVISINSDFRLKIVTNDLKDIDEILMVVKYEIND